MKSSKTILIIDDDKGVHETFEALLTPENHHLLFAENGAKGIEMLNSRKPDLVLLDVMMPDMDGFEVCRKIKENGTNDFVPVILITALSSKSDLVAGLDSGADEFLSKPVVGAELRARVRSMLRIREQHEELKETLAVRERLTKIIVNDMKSPMTAALVYSELLKMKIREPEEFDRIEKVWMMIGRLNNYLNELLILSKMKAKNLMLNKSISDLHDFVRVNANKHSMLCVMKKVHMIMELPEKPLFLSFDESLMSVVLDTVIIRAIQDSGPGDSILVRMEQEKKPANYPRPLTKIEVVDMGRSMDDEEKEKVYKTYLPAEVTEQKDENKGVLGYAFCHMVMKAHGGKLVISDNSPSGKRISLML